MANDFNLSVGVKVDADKGKIQEDINRLSKELKAIDLGIDTSSLDKVSVALSNNIEKEKQIKTITGQVKDEYGQLLSATVKINNETGELISTNTKILANAQQMAKAREDTATQITREKQLSQELLEIDQREAEYQKQRAQYLTEGKKQAQEYATQMKKVADINEKLNENKVSSDISGVKSKYSTLASVPESLKSDYSKLTSLSEQLNTSLGNKEKIAVWDEYEATLKSVKNQMSQTEKEAGRLATASEKITTIASLKNYLSKNTGIDTKSKDTINSWLNELESGADVAKSKTDEMTASLKKLDAEQRQAGKLGLSLADSFKQQAKTFTSWITVSGAVMLVVSGIKNAFSELKDVNTILTEISKTNDSLSADNLVKLGQESFATASKYGQKATDYLTSVQEMNRSGYYGELGNQMAELSTLAQSAGDMTADVSQQYLLATNAAYKYQGSVEKLNAALDGQNEINNIVSLYRECIAS